MEKVKVTQEQADAINYATTENHKYKTDPDRLLRDRIGSNVTFHCQLYELNNMDVVTLAKALYIGYEVEPKFKVGDWVAVDWYEGTGVYKIVGVQKDKVTIDNEFPNRNLRFKDVRDATPYEIKQEKERRWWKKHGRDVWELRKNDIISLTESRTVHDFRVCEVGDDSILLNGYIPVSGAFRSVTLDEIKEKYQIVCFAEDRKDGGSDA